MPYIKELINAGGPIMYVLLGCLGLATIIFLDRFFYLHRARIDTQEFLRGLFNILKNGKAIEAIAICDDTKSPIANMARAVICHSDQEEPRMRMAVDDTALTEIPRMQRNLKLLACLGQIAPVLGLLGTLISLMNIFAKIQDQGHFVETIQLAGDVRIALITTVAGLIVAMTVQLFYFLLAERIDTIVQEMEKAASEIINFLLTRKFTLADSDPTGQGDDGDGDGGEGGGEGGGEDGGEGGKNDEGKSHGTVEN